MIYQVKTKVEKVLKSEIYNGQIYQLCLDFLEKFNTIDKILSHIEKYVPTEEDSDDKLIRMENRYFRLQNSLYTTAKETNDRLLSMSDYYKSL